MTLMSQNMARSTAELVPLATRSRRPHGPSSVHESQFALRAICEVLQARLPLCFRQHRSVASSAAERMFPESCESSGLMRKWRGLQRRLLSARSAVGTEETLIPPGGNAHGCCCGRAGQLSGRQPTAGGTDWSASRPRGQTGRARSRSSAVEIAAAGKQNIEPFPAAMVLRTFCLGIDGAGISRCPSEMKGRVGAQSDDSAKTRQVKLCTVRSAESGMRKLPQTAAEDLLEIVMRRYERASTLLTSNRPVEDWGKLLGDAAAVGAMLDRLLHHGHLLKCGPRSWRTKTAATAD